MDYYEMEIWSRNYEDNFEEQVNRVYNSLLEMNKIENLEPKYLTAMSKESAPEFELTRENVEQLIKRHTDKKFPELGANFGLFTSKDDNKICGIGFSTGIKKQIFVNSVTINISFMNLQYDIAKRNQIISLLNKLVEINEAFYACIFDNTNYNLYDGYYNHTTKLPKSVFWVNYWGNEIIDRLPKENLAIENIKDEVYQLRRGEKGYFIRLSETSIFDDEEKVALQRKVNKKLGLQ